MDTTALFLTGIIFIHIVSILLLLLNSLFVVCTRYKENGEKRCCKIGNDLACNLLFLYHSVLVALELSLALLCQITGFWKDIFPNQNLVDIFMISAGVNYLFVLLYLAPRIVSVDTLEGNGCASKINATKPFAFISFFLFWYLLALILICTADCRFTSGFGTLAKGYGAIPLVICYVLMLLEARFTNMFILKLDTVANATLVSRDDAVKMLHKKLEGQPYIEGTVIGSHQIYTEFAQNTNNCPEVTKYTFHEGARWTTEKSTSVSLPRLFKKKYTNLIVTVAVRPNTDQIKEDIQKYFTQLKEKLDWYGVELEIKARYKFTESYLVTDSTNKIPWILKPSVYWMFAFLGVSVPFRMLLYCTTDNVTYTIQKHVFNSDVTGTQVEKVIDIPP